MHQNHEDLQTVYSVNFYFDEQCISLRQCIKFASLKYYSKPNLHDLDF